MSAVHPEVAYMEECGCRQIGLGRVQMPDGYSLWLDADGAYYFWLRHADGNTSTISCDRWSVYRGAVADAKRRAA